MSRPPSSFTPFPRRKVNLDGARRCGRSRWRSTSAGASQRADLGQREDHGNQLRKCARKRGPMDRTRLQRHEFLYVLRSNPHELRNQLWPDSYDAFYFEDGQLFDAAFPYAPVTVQGYARDALLIGARLAPADERAQ